MISSIFGKTKPINFIILLGFLFLFYWCVQFYVIEKEFSTENIVVEILALSLLLFSIFVVDFIVKRNKLTGPNSFSILFFTLLIVVFPETLGDNNAILSCFFLLLASRRLLSLKSLKNIKSKIFDTTLWIMISSLFYEWNLLFMILVFSAIYIYEPKNIRNWLTVLPAVICYFFILYSILILMNYTQFIEDHYDFNVDFNSIVATGWSTNIKLIVYAFLNLLLAFFAFLKLGKSGVGKIVTIRLIAISFVIGLLVTLMVSTAQHQAIIITFFPSVIFIGNYIESIKKPNILEVVLMLSIFLPLMLFLSKLIIS
ncbi:hypothetical protein [Maribacter sp. 2210JD10-5]|uniref:hypothetical protein n=1 Tax=Maribacter sp. 2210JD10-5 TaxID=3386272 RepID=UPI0039BD0A9D